MGQHVTSVDIEPAHTQAAAKTLANHNIRNVTLATGDGAHGWGQAHFDVIVLGGSVPQLAPAFEAQLKLGGRLLAIVGDAPAMHAQLITRVTPAACQQVTLFETSVPALQNAPHPQRFVF
jgi:protein-L-isoaspartate(D-aspartate) O-methyltransferase